jgi:membrane associated rhomboid family serine protease
MLEDRDYMRQSDEYSRMFRAVPMTYLLIAANLIVFVWTEIARGYFIGGYEKTFNYFALSNDGLSHGFVWQYLTFQFLHLGPMHFVFNMMGLYFLGKAVEDLIGSKRFLLLYLGSGIVGGILQTGLGLIFPTTFGIPVAGASAGVFGLLAALATLEPNVTILLFFILPVQIRYVAWAGALGAAFYILVPAQPGIAHAAHLGGMIGGFAYIRQFIQHRWHMPQWKLHVPRPAPRELAVKRAGKSSSWNSKSIPPAEDLSADEFLQKEVDPILDKISSHGIQSLTAREREILEKARSRINKR